MNRDQRQPAEAQIKITHLIPQRPKAPDAPIGPQVRDPTKDVLSAFTVLQQAFFGR